LQIDLHILTSTQDKPHAMERNCKPLLHQNSIPLNGHNESYKNTVVLRILTVGHKFYGKIIVGLGFSEKRKHAKSSYLYSKYTRHSNIFQPLFVQGS
jgi:hypothetical protein